MENPSPLTAKLIEYIETRVVSGEFRVGSRIPSVRRLAAKFELSYGTVYRALEHLCGVGILERRGKSGIFVKSRRIMAGGAGRIAVIMEPYVMERESGLCFTAFMGIQDIALQHGYSLQISYVPLTGLNEKTLLNCVRDADGLLLLNEYDRQFVELVKLPIPVVGMLMQNLGEPGPGLVNIDPIETAWMALKFFREQSHYLKKLVIFANPRPVYYMRAHMVKMLWELQGGPVELRFQNANELTEYEPETGYFFTSDEWANLACKAYMASTGKLLPEHHLILSVDGKQFLDPDFYRFPTIAVNWRRVGEVMMDEIIRMLSDDRAFLRNINLRGKLVMPGEAGL